AGTTLRPLSISVPAHHCDPATTTSISTTATPVPISNCLPRSRLEVSSSRSGLIGPPPRGSTPSAPLPLLAHRLRRRHLTGPGDGLHLLGGPEGDRLQHSGVRQQVDQAGLDLLA